MRPVVARKAAQRLFRPAAHREHLEKLAHLGGRKQEVGLRRERRIVQRVLDVRLAQDVRDAAVDEELRLRGVALDLQPCLVGGSGEGEGGVA